MIAGLLDSWIDLLCLCPFVLFFPLSFCPWSNRSNRWSNQSNRSNRWPTWQGRMYLADTTMHCSTTPPGKVFVPQSPAWGRDSWHGWTWPNNWRLSRSVRRLCCTPTHPHTCTQFKLIVFLIEKTSPVFFCDFGIRSYFCQKVLGKILLLKQTKNWGEIWHFWRFDWFFFNII